MPTFSVPDDDSDVSMSDEQQEQDFSSMEIEGDSFEAEVDGITRVPSDPNWQAQAAIDIKYEQQYRAQQAAREQAEAEAQAYIQTQARLAADTPAPKKRYNFRPAQSVRGRTSPNTLFADIPMLHTDLPSSIGKRKRSESQPPARDTYHSDPDTTSSEQSLRRVGGMFVTMYTVAFTWLAGVYTYFRGQKTTSTPSTPAQEAQEQEVCAVETDVSGRKRRAIPSGSFRVPSESPSSQGSNSPRSPEDKITATTKEAPGAFPSQSLPSPERSQSPVVEKTEKTEKTKPTVYNKQSTYPNEMPNITEYMHTYLGGVDSVEPTMDEMRERMKGKRAAVTWDDWNAWTEEKKEKRKERDREEYLVWAAKQDEARAGEDYEFWRNEVRSMETDRLDAKWAAAQEKFGDEVHEIEINMLDPYHHLQHSKGECTDHEVLQKFHEYDGLAAHTTAKVVEAEVAADANDFYWANKNEWSPREPRAMMRPTTLQLLYGGRPYEGKGKARVGEEKQSRSTRAQRLLSKQKEQPTSVAAAKNDNGQGPAGATKEDASRPTTSSSSSSSHKPASYKGGLSRTPNHTMPGANWRRPWTYNKTMAPGKPVLKRANLKGEEKDKDTKGEQKDKEIDALIGRSKKLLIQSPQDERYQTFKTRRQNERKQRALLFKEQIDEKDRLEKEWAEGRRQEANRQAVELLKVIRGDWAQHKLNEAAKQKAEEEEAARQAAEELAKQKAIEDERERKAAEEAAKLKAEEAAAKIRKAEEEKAEKIRKEQEEKKAGLTEEEYARRQILIRDLDPHWKTTVQQTMSNDDMGRPVATSLDGTALSRRDFGKLLPQEGTSDDSSGWLNDEIVNAFITAIVGRKQELEGYVRSPNMVPGYESYNTGWYSTFKSQRGVAGLASWSRRKGIAGTKLLKTEKVFLPINTGGHWTLLIISGKERKIEYLDSLNRKPAAWFKVAREWLAMELKEKYDADEWTESSVKSSCQTNTDDCGVFVAMNALAAGKGYSFKDVDSSKMENARWMIAAVLINGGLKGDWEL